MEGEFRHLGSAHLCALLLRAGGLLRRRHAREAGEEEQKKIKIKIFLHILVVDFDLVESTPSWILLKQLQTWQWSYDLVEFMYRSLQYNP